MTTRCKFRCNSVKDNGETQDVDMAPVYGDSEENKSFWKWTPSGSFVLTQLTKKVSFTPGKEYYLDISEVPAPQPVVDEAAPEAAKEGE